MTLVPAGTAHAAGLAAIHAACFAPPERWDAAAFATLLAMPGSFALIAPEGGMAVLRVAADEMEVLTLAVHPASRRRGLGLHLLEEAALQGLLAGAGTVFLEVAEDNGAARALYARAGFRAVGRRRGYYPGGGDALVLRASLPLGLRTMT